MHIENHHEIREVKRWVSGKQHRVKVTTVVDPTDPDFLKTSVNTCLVPERMFRPYMMDWPEVIAIQEAAEKLATRIIQEIE
nr:MAG TPA: hypothetical protein [Bacteriophage sp.]